MSTDPIFTPEVITELFWVVRERARLEREGGSLLEREEYERRRAALERVVEDNERQAAQRVAERAKTALCVHGAHCADWPLCGHDSGA